MDKVVKSDVAAFIKGRLAELLNINKDEIGDDELFIEELGTTSIMIVDLFVSIEEKYKEDMQSRFDLTTKLSVNILSDMITNLAGEV